MSLNGLFTNGIRTQWLERRHHRALLWKRSEHFAFCLQKHRSVAYGLHDTAPAKTQVEGVRGILCGLGNSSCIRSRALPLPHGGDHTGRMVRSKGEARGRVHGRRRGQHVAGVAERGDVTQRWHVSGEGSRVEGAALGEVLQRIMHLFALFGFARHLPVSGLDAFLLHSQGSVNLNKDQFFFFLLFCCLWNGTGF